MRTFFLFIVFTLSFYTSLQAEPSYDIIDLNPPESRNSCATDINELGQVTGFYFKNNDQTPYLFLWDKENGFKLLGETQTTPRINNLGHIITTKTVGRVKYHPYLWTPEKGEQLFDIPNELKNEILVPVGINDYDQVLIRNQLKYSSADKVWVWSEGEYQQIKDLSSANNLTNSQLISGVVCIKPSKNEKVYLPTMYDLHNKMATPLVFPNKKTITGYLKMFNENGIALGKIYDVAARSQKYFSWHKDTGVNYIEDFAPAWINSTGEMIGWKINPFQNYYEVHLFDGSKYKNIEIEAGIGYDIDIPFRTLNNLYRFNSQRQIVGQGRLIGNGEWKYHAFMIEPKKK